MGEKERHNDFEYEVMSEEEERRREEERPQPIVPGENEKKPHFIPKEILEAGQGNFGHKGRPGEVGGSSSSGGGSSKIIDKVRSEDTNKMFVDDDFETRKNIVDFKQKILEDNGRKDVVVDSYKITTKYTEDEKSLIITNFEEDLKAGKDTNQIQNLKLNKEVNNEVLKKKYGDTISLYRGVGPDEESWIPENQMLSWSENREVAVGFAVGKYESKLKDWDKVKILKADVPTDDVWLSHLTDNGITHLKEKEFVTIHKSKIKFEVEEVGDIYD